MHSDGKNMTTTAYPKNRLALAPLILSFMIEKRSERRVQAAAAPHTFLPGT
jgi:hypothetical protein